MITWQEQTISRKLTAILMLTSTAAIIVASVAVIVFYTLYFRNTFFEDLHQHAEVISQAIEAAIAFDVPEGAYKAISSFSTESSIKFACILDKNGDIFAQYRRNDALKNTLLPDLRGKESGYRDGFLHVIYPFDRGGHVTGTIYIKADMNKIYDSVKKVGGIIILSIIVSLVTAYIISLQMQRVISNPILALAKTAKSISKDKDFSVRAEKVAFDEIGKLIDSFNEMLSQIQHRDDALRESEERFRTLVNNIPGVSYRCAVDEHWTMEFISDEVETISGYPAADFIQNSVRSYASIIHPDDAQIAGDTAMERVLRKETYMIEYRVVRADGDVRWVYEKGTGIFDENGDVRFLDGVIIDNTERKQAEEQIKSSLKEKEILLQEIHHRVKNNMQVITSLLKLQATKIDDEQYVDMFKESQTRIKSMALVHEKLYRSKSLADVDFKEYIKSLSISLFRSYGPLSRNIDLKTDVEDVSLGLEGAVPCGLIINELVSNSIKYAFPEQKKGEIRIAFYSLNEEEIVLEVSDNGIGMPEELDIRNVESMGLHLVKILSERQLRGKIELSRTGGTHFHIRFRRLKYKERV